MRARLDAGARTEDGECFLRGKDPACSLEQEFGVKRKLGSNFGVLGRLGYCCHSPRPRHERSHAGAVT